MNYAKRVRVRSGTVQASDCEPARKRRRVVCVDRYPLAPVNSHPLYVVRAEYHRLRAKRSYREALIVVSVRNEKEPVCAIHREYRQGFRASAIDQAAVGFERPPVILHVDRRLPRGKCGLRVYLVRVCMNI
jgi:hypothetical protein